MKRYLIFAAIGPLLGGFWLLLTTTTMSGYFSHPPTAAEIGKLLAVFATTLHFSYLFGLLPALMIGAIEDILWHVKRIGPTLLARAREHFMQAARIMDTCGRAVVRSPRLMASVYSEILERIAKRGFAAPRQRVSLGKARLLLIVLRHGVH